MNKTFWQSIKEHDYAVPTGFSVKALTPELLSYLGSLDFELRDDFAYRILIEWFDRGHYSHADLWEMATLMLHNLTSGLGEHKDDTVLLRSYSVLILMEIVYYDVITIPTPMFAEAKIQQILAQVLVYFRAEKDLRDYEPGKGWMHAVAHAADCSWILAQHRFVSLSDLERIMDALVEKIATPAHVYLFDEDERLARTVMGALQRDLLTLPFLTAWLEQLTHPRGHSTWSDTDEADNCARHNSKHFLRSLYFQLRSPGFAGMPHVKQRPAIADALLPLVEEALSQIQTWC